MKKQALIIGGTSGLGFELALTLSSEHDVFVVGREDPKADNFQFRRLNLADDTLEKDLTVLVDSLPEIDLVIYAAGYYQEVNRDTSVIPAKS